MAYILDTYNVIHAGAAMGGPVAYLTVQKLCAWIDSKGLAGVSLVLDGRAKPDEPSENEFPAIELVYSGAGITADHVIAQKVERSGKPGKITVVSNDGQVVLHARRNHAKVISCEAFLAMLVGTTDAKHAAQRARDEAKKSAGSPTTGETDHWLKEFGMQSPPPPPPKPHDDDFHIDMDSLIDPK